MNDAPIFIGGAARSGTTLVRAILDSHSRIACGPELKLGTLILHQWQQFKWAQALLHDAQRVAPEEADALYRQLFLGLLQPYRRASGKPRIAEKTPSNTLHFCALHALFPGAKCVHVIRDGRDVVASLLRTNWLDPVTGKPASFTKDVAEATRYWAATVRAAAELGPDYLELRYCDLVLRSEATLRSIFSFLGEEWEGNVLNFHEIEREDEPNAKEIARPIHPGSIGRAGGDLSASDLAIVMEIAAPLLEELGYLDPVQAARETRRLGSR